MYHGSPDLKCHFVEYRSGKKELRSRSERDLELQMVRRSVAWRRAYHGASHIFDAVSGPSLPTITVARRQLRARPARPQSWTKTRCTSVSCHVKMTSMCFNLLNPISVHPAHDLCSGSRP